jgi:hypothetical protein
MEEQTLFMLCDPKKCKPNTQNTMDVFINNYTQHNNILNSNNENNPENNNNGEISDVEQNSDDEIKEIEVLPDFMIEVAEHINHIDHFILNHNYDKHMEKINDYLIDLLFLIKSKKKK